MQIALTTPVEVLEEKFPVSYLLVAPRHIGGAFADIRLRNCATLIALNKPFKACGRYVLEVPSNVVSFYANSWFFYVPALPVRAMIDSYGATLVVPQTVAKGEWSPRYPGLCGQFLNCRASPPPTPEYAGAPLAAAAELITVGRDGYEQVEAYDVKYGSGVLRLSLPETALPRTSFQAYGRCFSVYSSGELLYRACAVWPLPSAQAYAAAGLLYEDYRQYATFSGNAVTYEDNVMKVGAQCAKVVEGNTCGVGFKCFDSNCQLRSNTELTLNYEMKVSKGISVTQFREGDGELPGLERHSELKAGSITIPLLFTAPVLVAATTYAGGQIDYPYRAMFRAAPYAVLAAPVAISIYPPTTQTHIETLLSGFPIFMNSSADFYLSVYAGVGIPDWGIDAKELVVPATIVYNGVAGTRHLVKDRSVTFSLLARREVLQPAIDIMKRAGVNALRIYLKFVAETSDGRKEEERVYDFLTYRPSL